MLAWLLNTKIGRGIAVGLSAIAFAVVVYWRIYTAGRRTERAAQDQKSLKNYQTREAIHEDVVTRPVDARRSDLGRWVQPD